MYFIVSALFMLVLPGACVAAEYAWLHTSADLVALAGKWFTFWGVGTRLGIAGLGQAFNPSFAALESDRARTRLRQSLVGAVGTARVCFRLDNVPAIAGGLFVALAGWKHARVNALAPSSGR